MSKRWQAILDWLPAVAALGLVVGATAYTWVHVRQARGDIRKINDLAKRLTATAAGVERGVLSPDQAAEVKARRDELVDRVRDSMKQIVPQLSEAAREAGLNILGIKPILKNAGHQPAPGNGDSANYPNYRVTVQGSYRRIAEFMQGCSRQRIPARVTAFRIEPSAQQGNGQTLKAQITVEAFRAKRAVLSGSAKRMNRLGAPPLPGVGDISRDRSIISGTSLGEMKEV